MFRQTVKILTPEGILLWEAMRRMLCMGKKKSVNDRMLGLGYPSYYKDGVKAGLFVPTFGKTIPRVATWYRLTTLGQAIVKQVIRKKLRSPKNCHDVNGCICGTFTVMTQE